MSADLKGELELLEMEHKLVALREEFQAADKNGATAHSFLKNESNRRRLTHFLQWLLTPEAAHSGEEAFLDEFLSFCAINKIDITSIDTFSGEDRSKKTNKTKFDFVLIGQDACLGVVLQQQRQQRSIRLGERYEALNKAFPNPKYHELVYVGGESANVSVPDGNLSTIKWDDLLEQFESQLDTIPEADSRQLIYDFIATVQSHI